MKTKLFLLLFTGVFFFSNAQDIGKVIIRNASINDPKFIASLNGIRLTNDYVSEVVFPYLDEKNYSLKILLSGSSGILNFRLNSEPQYLSKYVLVKDNFGNYKLMLESKSLLTGNEFVQTPTLVPTQTLSPATTVIVTQTVAAPTQTFEPPGGGTSVAAEALSTAEFNERLNAIKKTSFDKDKLSKAKQVFDDELLTVNQVVEVVKVFSFDDSKLDFAKWAYKYTSDKRNYFKVEDYFSFNSSKNELREFVKKQPK